MVPASGAADTCIHDLYAFLDADHETPQTESEKLFFDRIQDFVFYGSLNEACLRNNWKPIQKLIAQNEYKTIIRNSTNKEGIGLLQPPKRDAAIPQRA